MNTTPISVQDPTWCRALDLAERLVTLRATADTGQPPRADREAALIKLQGWKEQPPFADGALFAERLSADHITEDELLHLLGEPIEAVHARLPQAPGWVTRLAPALEQQAGPADGTSPATVPLLDPRAAP